MTIWFECKVKYDKIVADGSEKMVSEPYLIDAVSFTDAESRIHKELEAYISGEFTVSTIKIANYSELIPNDDGDRWFKCKVTFISLDEEKGVERRSNTYMLVQANNVKEAYENCEKALSDTMSDFEIPSVQESPLLDVFTYFGDDKDQEIPENLKPISEISENEDFDTSEDE
ncbi:MAG: DUF4494 domain-containing protein [Salinivirgaceae bacterium]|nr:DUF4494 domain-containing protein [Salinivirgaceae bacterium]